MRARSEWAYQTAVSANIVVQGAHDEIKQRYLHDSSITVPIVTLCQLCPICKNRRNTGFLIDIGKCYLFLSATGKFALARQKDSALSESLRCKENKKIKKKVPRADFDTGLSLSSIIKTT